MSMKKKTPNPNHFSNPLELYGDVKSTTRIFTWFLILVLLSLIVAILALLTNRNYFQAILIAIYIPIIVAGFFIIGRQKFELAAAFLAVTLFFLITLQSTYGLGIHHIANMGIPAILIIASLVIRKRTLVFLTLFAIGCIGWLVFGEIWGWYTPQLYKESIPGDFISASVIIIATAIMVSVLSDAVINSNRGLHRELVERERAEKRLAYDAHHDALTDLPNRTLFLNRLGQRLEMARLYPEKLFAVLFIDLDRFKVVNDSLGHAVGDQLLITTAQRLVECLRAEDTVARLSGDEFAILLHEIEDSSDATLVADRIQFHLMATSMLGIVNRVTTASIGISVYQSNYTQPHEMLRDADSAMYRAKASGGGCFQVFDDTMYASAISLLQMEADLKRAVENQEWEVYYQPIVSLPGQEIKGVEALVRWIHPERGLINPAEFIHIAEETGQILNLGEFVLRTACLQARYWREHGFPNLWVSVNLSGRQFHEKNIVSRIDQILLETGLPPTGLQLEVTESVTMKDLSYTARVLNDLSRRGIGTSLDDFGNGYSSLGYLNQFAFQALKIDRSFVRDIQENRSSEAIIQAIISMGHTLNLEVVAEGVETPRQLDFLQSNGCDFYQGFSYSRPVPAEQLEKLLQKRQS